MLAVPGTRQEGGLPCELTISSARTPNRQPATLFIVRILPRRPPLSAVVLPHALHPTTTNSTMIKPCTPIPTIYTSCATTKKDPTPENKKPQAAAWQPPASRIIQKN